jgi:integrase
MGEVVMISQGVIFKRCGCQDPASGRRLGRTCPQLAEGRHGSWYFHVSVTNLMGRRERVRRGGYPTRAAARHARDEALGRSQQDQSGHAWTVERWLRYWLSTRVGIRPTTRLSHTQYIERFLIPHVGKIRLAELTARQLTAFFAAVGQETNRFGQPHTPTTLAHIRTTLRAALNSAIREGLIQDNPARQVELPSRRRAHALVWTPGRVADWHATGIRPTVAVWTAAQLAAFLDSVRQDRLYALWWLAALRGLRRGELAGLRWADLDLDHRQLMIVRARTTAGYQIFEGPPKSAASTRTIALDRHTIAVLRQHARRQRRECDTAPGRWHDTGYVFTNRHGNPLHPGFLTHRLAALVAAAGLPPIRLHDLRHGAATLAHLAGTDLKTIQDQLGHSSIVLTADTYTSVLPAAQHKAAEATARLVLDAARNDRNKIAIVARRLRAAARKSQKVSALTPAADRGHPRSPAVSRTLEATPAAATARQPHSNHRPHRTQ